MSLGSFSSAYARPLILFTVKAQLDLRKDPCMVPRAAKYID